MNTDSESLESFAAGAAQMGIELNEAQRRAFASYAEGLLLWNDRINLLGPAAVRELWSRHMLDSLTLVRALPAGAAAEPLTLVDVGSGAGFPGVPLQIAFPHWQVTLVEATGKRARFLEEAAAVLPLPNLLVVRGRSEDVAHDRDHREVYDLCAARAVTHLAGLVELTLPFVRRGGMAVLFKTLSGLSAETADAEAARVVVGAAPPEVVAIAGGEGGRCLVRYRKVSGTPPGLPRRAGVPEHSPLTREDGENIAASEREAARHTVRPADRRRRPR